MIQGAIASGVAGLLIGYLAGCYAVMVPDGGWKSLERYVGSLKQPTQIESLLGMLLGCASLAANFLSERPLSNVVVSDLFLLLLVFALLIDFRHHLVYPVIVLAGFLAAAVLNPLVDRLSWESSLIGAGTGAAIFLFLFLLGILLFRAQVLGFGDILLAGMIGAMVGLPKTPLTLCLGAIISAVMALLFLAFRRKTMQDYLPFGSGMCLAAVIMLVL